MRTEEIDIIELLKRVKEGNAPKKIEMNGSKYLYNEKSIGLYSLYEASSDAIGNKEFWIDNEGIDLNFDTKIKILDKPIIEELEIDSGENTTQRIFEEKINEIIKWINKENKDE